MVIESVTGETRGARGGPMSSWVRRCPVRGWVGYSRVHPRWCGRGVRSLGRKGGVGGECCVAGHGFAGGAVGPGAIMRGVRGTTRMYFLKNFLFYRVTLPDPSTPTTYWSNCRTSTTNYDSRFVPLGGVWSNLILDPHTVSDSQR